ncbi:MAG: hypothetical protein WED87_09035 [Dehalococcoidia bacterium]
MRILTAFAIAFGLFAAGFVLHIVGGAADIEGLFQFAVVWIFVSALGFPATVLTFAGVELRSRQGLLVLGGAFLGGFALTVGTLWAANDRTFAPWQFPAAAILVGAVSGLKLGLDALGGGRTLRGSARG